MLPRINDWLIFIKLINISIINFLKKDQVIDFIQKKLD